MALEQSATRLVKLLQLLVGEAPATVDISVVGSHHDAAGEDHLGRGEILRTPPKVAQASAEPFQRREVLWLKAQGSLERFNALVAVPGGIRCLTLQVIVAGHGRRRFARQRHIGAGQLLLSQGLAGLGPQAVEGVAGRPSCLSLLQVSDGCLRRRWGRQRLPRALVLPAPEHIVGQPDKLLVGKSANLFDLILSQQALLQPGTPVVAL